MVGDGRKKVSVSVCIKPGHSSAVPYAPKQIQEPKHFDHHAIEWVLEEHEQNASREAESC